MTIVFVVLVFVVIVVGLIVFSDIPMFWMITKIIRTAQEYTKQEKVTLQAIDKMSGSDFERCCADLLLRNGFSQVHVTGDSGDQGVDIIAYKDGKKYAVQCKRYNQKLGNKPVQEVFTGKSIYKCDEAIVMTNNHFTKGAKDAADATGVLLWDRDTIGRMMQNIGSAK